MKFEAAMLVTLFAFSVFSGVRVGDAAVLKAVAVICGLCADDNAMKLLF